MTDALLLSYRARNSHDRELHLEPSVWNVVSLSIRRWNYKQSWSGVFSEGFAFGVAPNAPTVVTPITPSN
jgi:hypothetical protein